MGKKKLLLSISLALVLVVVGLAGCSPDNTAAGGLEDITWILESYGEQRDLQAVLEGTEITAIFDSAEGQVTGSAGANNYFGGYQTSKNELTIQQIAQTEMYRLDPEGVMDQEAQYLKALQSAESYEISAGKLSITAGSKVLIFRASEE